MPLYLGLAADAQGLGASAVEIDDGIRRVVFNRTLTFDRDFPGCNGAGETPVMWADALDRLLARLAAAAEIDVESLRAIGGAASQDEAIFLNGEAVATWQRLKPSVALAAQITDIFAPPTDATRSHDAGSFLSSLLAGTEVPRQPNDAIVGRLAAFWQKRYALPRAAVLPWTSITDANLIATGVIRDGIVFVSLGEWDSVASPKGETRLRNGSRARERMRREYQLDRAAIARYLDASPGNDGGIMLPWFDSETTPPVAHPGLRRFGFDRHSAAMNVRGLIEGQMMALANSAATIAGGPIDKVIATGGETIDHALLQVMANVFGADVYRLEIENAAALGAALRAYHVDRLEAGAPVSWDSVVSGFSEPKPAHRVAPNPKLVAMYAELRKDYAMLERIHRDRQPIC